MNFRNNLKELIERNGLNANQLAIKLNLSRSTISCYLSGKRKPSLAMLKTLKDFFKCSYDDLLE